MKLLKIEQVAKLLHISQDAVKARIKSGKLKGSKRGASHVLLTDAQIIRFRDTARIKFAEQMQRKRELQ